MQIREAKTYSCLSQHPEGLCWELSEHNVGEAMLCILLWWRHPVESADPGIHIGLQRFGLLSVHFQKQIHLYCNQRMWNTLFHKHGRINLRSYGSCVYGQTRVPQEGRSLRGQMEGGSMPAMVSSHFLKTRARILTSIYHINFTECFFWHAHSYTVCYFTALTTNNSTVSNVQ